MGGIDFTPVGVLTALLQVLIILFSLSIHESAHAWMADRLGDPTARMLGRITLNPLPHIDPIGTILLPLVLAISGGPVFGWAKPVPVVSRHFKHLKRDEALVGVAGPISNLLLALLCTTVLGGILIATGPSAFWAQFQTQYSPVWWILRLALINLILAGFNLIPIPPLDGSWVLSAVLPHGVAHFYDSIRRFGPILLLVLFLTPLLELVLSPVVNLLYAGFIVMPLGLLSGFLGG